MNIVLDGQCGIKSNFGRFSEIVAMLYSTPPTLLVTLNPDRTSKITKTEEA